MIVLFVLIKMLIKYIITAFQKKFNRNCKFQFKTKILDYIRFLALIFNLRVMFARYRDKFILC